MNRQKFFWLLPLALALALTTSAQVSAAVSTAIATDSTNLTANEDVRLRFTLANDGKESAKILRWEVPVAGIDDDYFEVTRNGKEVLYLGRHVKRGTPTASDFFVLKSGEALNFEVELSAFYDLSVTGEYSVRFHPHVSLSHGAKVGASNAVTIWIDGADVSKYEQALLAPPVEAASTAFRNCSSSQQTTLATARTNATNYANNSSTYLNGLSATQAAASQRYKTWFGTYTSSRFNTVKSHFTSIKTALTNAAVTFDCGCSDNYYAYVYPTRPYEIWLCNAFWSAPATGTDSKAGTVVHEMSHFNIVAATDDWAYGQTACKNLANQNPKKAVDNADSHEYFAENTPSLP
jgi:peptidyl-Lys metalloendopeptidase